MKTRKFWGFFLALTMILTINIFPASRVDAAGTRQVLLIQSTKPWGLNTNNDLLAGFQTSGVISGYDERTFAQVNAADFDLSGYAMIMISNSQNYSAYNATTKAKLEAYAQAGGVVLFGACCQSTMPISIKLPGDVEVSLDFQANNVIVDPASPVVTGILSNHVALTDSDLNGNSCSHTSFTEATLPIGANVILRAKTNNKPTLAEYPLGNGKVIVSGLTWEYYNNTITTFSGKAYDDLLLYALPITQAAPTGLSGSATSFAGESDGKISGTTPAMEYKLSSASVYTPASATETTGLAAGTYDVRVAGKLGYMPSPSVSVLVAAGPARTYTLAVTVPSFTGILSSDPQPDAKPITITNSGNSASAITGVAASNSDFIVAGSGSAVSIGGSISSWTVQPAAGLSAGTHTATITVTYNGGAEATADVSIVVTPAAPAGLTGLATSFAGESDGKISGTTSAMEYKLSSDLTYSPASDTETTGLAAGTYDVRFAAITGVLASPSIAVTVSEGPARTYPLTVTAPSFTGIFSSDPQPEAKPIVITNIGNSASTITDISVSNTDFILAGSGNTVAVGDSINSWTVQPAAGLSAGTHTATITVTYTGGAVATADVSIVITPAAPTGLTGTTTSFAGEFDGKISGTTSAMEYKLSSAPTYSAASDTETTGLSAGTYDVRYAAKTGVMASPSVTVTVSEGPARTYTLTVAAPSFTGILSSDPQPVSKPIVITSCGNSASTITGVAVSNTAFIVAGSGNTVAAGSSINSWTVQPAAGLAAGTHTATVTVTYNGGAQVTADVSIVITQRVDAGAPVFTTNLDPAVSLINGKPASPLAVKAESSDGGTITYQWYMRSGDIVATEVTPDALAGTAIPGATGASYIPGTDTVGVFYYYAIATNTNNAVNGTASAQKVSAMCKATVVPLVDAAAPSFSLNVGGTASYTKDSASPLLTAKADATDGGAVTYQWYVKNGGSGSYTAIPGATGATYTPSTSTHGVYYYFVKATNTNNSVNGTRTASRDSEVLKVTITAVLGRTGELGSVIPVATLVTAGLALSCAAVLVIRKRRFH